MVVLPCGGVGGQWAVGSCSGGGGGGILAVQVVEFCQVMTAFLALGREQQQQYLQLQDTFRYLAVHTIPGSILQYLEVPGSTWQYLTVHGSRCKSTLLSRTYTLSGTTQYRIL